MFARFDPWALVPVAWASMSGVRSALVACVIWIWLSAFRKRITWWLQAQFLMISIRSSSLSGLGDS